MRQALDWGWLAENLDLIGDRLAEHLWLTALTVTIGLAISLPLSVLAYRRGHVYPPLTWVSGILYTIPSLALFAGLVPFVGLGTVPALIGLVSYTLLILIRNTVSGLSSVPEDVKEAARGMGYTRRELLWRVELPLAIPIILAGVRIATISTIGLVTVTVFVGMGGLGELMLASFRRLRPEIALYAALVLSLGLAIAIDALLFLAQRLAAPWATRRRALV